MINIFKRFKKEIVTNIEFAGKSNNELVAEIHETFETEVDRILAEAKILKSVPEGDADLLSKADRLSKIGFGRSKDSQEAYKHKIEVSSIESENSTKDQTREAVEYFSRNYPLYKFITEESVKKICGKYNLIYGEAGNYIGDVPEDNLKDMEAFKLAKEDEVWHEHIRGSFIQDIITIKNRAAYEFHKAAQEVTRNNMSRSPLVQFGIYETKYILAPLEIAAPIKDFNTDGMELDGFKLRKIEIPDPVVLQPVFFEGTKHYLIITAWGLEASDELVANHKFN